MSPPEGVSYGRLLVAAVAGYLAAELVCRLLEERDWDLGFREFLRSEYGRFETYYAGRSDGSSNGNGWAGAPVGE